MATKLYPIVQFKKDTWEIDEFDCASIFLLVGSEKAMLIDTGIGVGDLYGAVRQITDKPLIVVITHGHGDHIGNAWQFDEIYINPKDRDKVIYKPKEERMAYPRSMASRMHGSRPTIYQIHNLYGYDVEKDIIDPDPEKVKNQKIHDLVEGMTFDLGGGRIITAYSCEGHTAGQMMLLDEQTRSLFVGDGLNYNLGVVATPVETTLEGLKKMEALSPKYDGIYNGHHDFRGLGMPLGDDCLPNAIAILEDAMKGFFSDISLPNFTHPELGLTPMLVRERNYLRITKDLIHESDRQ